jgi:polysaccharide biosynthesis protein PslH
VNRPRVLFLAPKPPYPLTSGAAMRQFHFIRAYSSVADVDLAFFFNDDSDVEEARKGLAPYCRRIYPFPLPPARRQGHFGPWRGFTRTLTEPMLANILHSEKLQQLIIATAKVSHLIHVSRLHLANAVAPLLNDPRRKCRLVLDVDDIESVAKKRHMGVTPSRRLMHRLFHRFDLARLAAFERRVISRFDRVFVCSEMDRDALHQPNVVVVPNGISVPVDMPAREADDATLLFCGLLSYWPNVDAVRYCVRSIFPHIQRAIPGARLVVIGRAPSADLRVLANGTSVVLAADVPSVVDYYRRSTIAIVPLRIGGGTRIKILEAWALGVPVVSTSVGCEGLEAVAGEHLMVADDPEGFAEACINLLRSPSLRERLARRGRDLVWKTYRWETSMRRAIVGVEDLLSIATAPGRH